MKYQPSNQRGAVSTRLIVLAVLVVLAFVIFILSFFITSGRTPLADYRVASDTFVGLISKKDGPGSYAMLTDNFKKTVGPSSQWQILLENTFGKSKISSNFQEVRTPQGSSINKNPEAHWVIYTFKVNGTNWHSFILMVKNSAGWQVDGMESRAY